jgi:hypothetical protein
MIAISLIFYWEQSQNKFSYLWLTDHVGLMYCTYVLLQKITATSEKTNRINFQGKYYATLILQSQKDTNASNRLISYTNGLNK